MNDIINGLRKVNQVKLSTDVILDILLSPCYALMNPIFLLPAECLKSTSVIATRLKNQ